jgi:prepilin signal peptidase PulO-like enzyme (type II secretory pathway)
LSAALLRDVIQAVRSGNPGPFPGELCPTCGKNHLIVTSTVTLKAWVLRKMRCASCHATPQFYAARSGTAPVRDEC